MRKDNEMSNHDMPRPAVMDELSESQLQELEFQAAEYDRKEFLEIATNYGWDDETIAQVWRWFEIQNNYPLDMLDE